MSFAKGDKAWGISDRSGLRTRYRDMVTEWNGSKVDQDEFEEKHPQLRRRRRMTDAVALKDPRPDNDQELTLIGPLDNHGRQVSFQIGQVTVTTS